jgi:hypothetical protein
MKEIVIRHSPFAIPHSQLLTRNSSLATRYSQFVRLPW